MNILLLLQLPIEFILVYEGDRLTIRCLNEYFRRKSSIILDLQELGALFSVDNWTKVDCRIFYREQSFLTGAFQRNINLASFREDREHSKDVFVQLRSECICDGC